MVVKEREKPSLCRERERASCEVLFFVFYLSFFPNKVKRELIYVLGSFFPASEFECPKCIKNPFLSYNPCSTYPSDFGHPHAA